MKTFYKSGSIIDYTAGSAVSSDDVVAVGGLIGIAVDDIAANAVGPVMISGAVSVTKNAPEVWTIGADIYYDSGNANFTTTATGNSTPSVNKSAVV